MDKSHTISVLVENEFGVLARVASLFSSKGYNIDSLTVAETTDPTVSRMTIVTHGSEQIMEQILKQLDKLVNVLKVEDLTRERHLTREVLLVKVKGEMREKVEQVAERLHAKILEADSKAVILEITGHAGEISKDLDLLGEFGLLEVVRSGVTAIARGGHVL